MPLFIFLFLSISHFINPPIIQNEEGQIKELIIELFNGMRVSDAERVNQCFLPEATMHTTYNNNSGLPQLKKGNLQEFVNAIAAPKTEIWDERILDYQIKIDDNLATAWCPYHFYLDDQFLHCGVNAFQFIRGANGWKILCITDTRRKKGCLK